MKTFTELRRHLTSTNSQIKSQTNHFFKAQHNPVNEIQAMSKQINSLQARCTSKSKPVIIYGTEDYLTQSKSQKITHWKNKTIQVIEQKEQPSTTETTKNNNKNIISGDITSPIRNKKDLLSPNKRLQFISPNKANKVITSRTSILSPDSSMRARRSPKNNKNDNPITVKRFVQNPQKLNDSKIDKTKKKIQTKNILQKKEKQKLILRLKSLVELVGITDISADNAGDIFNAIISLEEAIKKN